jgi:lysozyme family protein
MNKLSDFTKTNIIRDKTAVEGGYVKNVNDSGGETNHGITAALANDYRQQLVNLYSWNGKMINLSVTMAYYLYETHFWKRLYCDDLVKRHPLFADKLFDMAINMGATTAATYFQQILNANNNRGALYADLKVDGFIGPATLRALDAYLRNRGKEGINRALCALLAEQGHHYLNLVQMRAKDEEFYYGWAGRVSRDMGIYVNVLGIKA